MTAAAPGARSALSVRDLTVTLGGRNGAEVVVDGVSFDLHHGEVLALVGESGCGKTKTAEALMGLLPATAALQASRMALGDVDLARLSEREWQRLRGRDLSMVFQEPLTALDPVLRVGEQLSTIYRRHRGLDRRTALLASAEMLERVGFNDTEFTLRRFPQELSGGQRQRILLAMAMACEPTVLIADEPTTALDVTTQAQVLERLTALARAAETAILLITHDLGVVAHYADRAMVMRRGRILECAPTAELFAHPAQPYTVGLLAAARGETV